MKTHLHLLLSAAFCSRSDMHTIAIKVPSTRTISERPNEPARFSLQMRAPLHCFQNTAFTCRSDRYNATYEEALRFYLVLVTISEIGRRTDHCAAHKLYIHYMHPAMNNSSYKLLIPGYIPAIGNNRVLQSTKGHRARLGCNPKKSAFPPLADPYRPSQSYRLHLGP